MILAELSLVVVLLLLIIIIKVSPFPNRAQSAAFTQPGFLGGGWVLAASYTSGVEAELPRPQ